MAEISIKEIIGAMLEEFETIDDSRLIGIFDLEEE